MGNLCKGGSPHLDAGSFDSSSTASRMTVEGEGKQETEKKQPVF